MQISGPYLKWKLGRTSYAFIGDPPNWYIWCENLMIHKTIVTRRAPIEKLITYPRPLASFGE